MNRHLLVYLLKEYYYIKEIILLISLMKCFKREYALVCLVHVRSDDWIIYFLDNLNMQINY